MMSAVGRERRKERKYPVLFLAVCLVLAIYNESEVVVPIIEHEVALCSQTPIEGTHDVLRCSCVASARCGACRKVRRGEE